MNLSTAEKSWLPWWGKGSKAPLGWACWLNRGHYPLVESIFNEFAASRKRILLDWTSVQWDLLEGFAEEAATRFESIDQDWLASKLILLPDFSEVFVLRPDGSVLATSATAQGVVEAHDDSALAAGLKEKFLHGPYADPVTERLGPTTSSFHDAVTLMFYCPVIVDGGPAGCLCGRVPNDVMSDLIQRESGHVYKQSGDNYCFMAQSNFDPAIVPGTALSRSRFEDDSFVNGDNLKQGIKTPYGVISVRAHTELEIVFNDPATGQLQPGVRETIRNGENLYVTYPGYSDYRHIPVIGKGVTFQLPGSPDTWGMMCEADLSEVYQRRSIGLRSSLRAGAVSAPVFALLAAYLGPTAFVPALIAFLTLMMMFWVFIARPLARRSETLLSHIAEITEGGGGKTIGVDGWPADTLFEIAIWTSNLSGKVEDARHQLDRLTRLINRSAETINSGSEALLKNSTAQSEHADSMASAVEELATGVRAIGDHSEEAGVSTSEMRATAVEGSRLMAQCLDEIETMNQAIADAASKIDHLNERSQAIGSIVETIDGIAAQTNLLSLNAAIEAARAGEVGRGFAVVADEVRSLSGNTAEATRQINDMIAEMQNETGHAVERVYRCKDNAARVVSISNDVGAALRRVDTVSEQIDTMIESIAVNARQQGTASNEVAKSVSVLAEDAQENDAALASNAIAINDLGRLSGQMGKISARL